MRTKLTLWYTGALALALIIFSAGVYWLASGKLQRRLDTGLQTTIEGIGRLLIYELAEGETETQALHSALNEHYFPSQAAAIFDLQGRLLAEKSLPDDHRVRLPPGIAPFAEETRFATVTDKTPKLATGRRVAYQRVTAARENKSYLIVVSQDLASISDDLELLRGIFLAAIPAALLLAGCGGWFLARKSLLPLVAMSESARRISAAKLDQRLPITNPRDELGQLAATFNELLTRLQASFAQQRQFMADASHELRTPLHVMRTAAEVTLEQPRRQESEYREALHIINEQARRLTKIVEDLFILARADAGQRKLEPRDFYLDELAAETTRAAAVLAARKQVAVLFEPVAEAPYRGDEALLRQMLLNLLDNAVKHTQAGGQVRLQLDHADAGYYLTVADTGEGIPAQAQPHIFKRFYRADQSRTRVPNGKGHSGAGLGLSIAQWIAEAHGGSLTLQQSGPSGSSFRVLLPEKEG
ncbi:MAG TPA: ATP-binding protein [Blastocatellia bacterium]|nr:ATP-binding protein [Blastocatellia bacterium]